MKQEVDAHLNCISWFHDPVSFNSQHLVLRKKKKKTLVILIVYKPASIGYSVVRDKMN